jgi:predicted dehydrogenase
MVLEMASKKISRRSFVGDVTAASGAFTIVPRHVLGGKGYTPPSDALNIACIGVGGKGRSDTRGMSHENIYAICDVDGRNLAGAAAEYSSAKTYSDYREMLTQEADNIDAVTISIPDHSHAAAAKMAMDLGKHAFVQKPLARTLGEVRVLKETARATGLTTQMGNQGHANEGTRQIREWVEAGVIGTVTEVQYWTNRPIWPQAKDRPLEQFHTPPHFNWDLWLGPAPARPFHPGYAHFNWRGWWDYGTGALGDIACHSMDAAFWALGLGYPERIEAETTRLYDETAPATSRIEYQFGARGSRGPIKVVWRDGGIQPSRPDVLVNDPSWGWGGDGGQIWVGTDGYLFAGIYGERPRLLDKARNEELMASPPAEVYPRSQGVFREFTEAAKAGTQAGSSFDGHAGPLTEMVLLGNLAVRANRPIDVDPNTGALLTQGIPEEFVNPEYRSGWSL